MIETKKLNSHSKSLLKYFSEPFEHKIKNKEYRNAWHLIHSMHIEEPHIQLEIFILLLKFFKKGKCACAHDAWTLFKNIIIDLENFQELEHYKEFWIFFHNQVNLKLSKSVYIL